MKSRSNGQNPKNRHPSLEERIATLEAEVERLKVSSPAPAIGGWESLVGSQANNPFFEQVMREMKQNRDAEYVQAKVEASTARKTRSKRRVVGAK